jgi:hypothetical protein
LITNLNKITVLLFNIMHGTQRWWEKKIGSDDHNRSGTAGDMAGEQKDATGCPGMMACRQNDQQFEDGLPSLPVPLGNALGLFLLCT